MGGRSPRDNLPAELNAFVGRRRELLEVRRLLAGNRLVTLTGPGGVGKTRLGVRVAGQLRKQFGDGMWQVEFAALTNPGLVPSAVARVLGVTDRSGRSVLSAVVDYLADKRLLLVLDNCEHLVDACAPLVSKLLAAAPGLRVLATSREPLRVVGERVVGVSPLSTPDPRSLPVGDLSEFEAVRLFAERARAVVPSFEVTRDNRVAVAGVCRRLDGIPLAIELAAARLRVLPVEQILARLEDRFRLLTTGSRVAPVRHQTLRATFDWSYGLCAPAERLLWARASAFAGGFDLEAAEAVCGGDGIDPSEIVDLVAGLLDKSILIREWGSDSSAWYGLLDTVRQYGRDRLVASGQEALLRGRHREYYRRLAARAEAERVSAREVEWLLRLRRELPNLRLAMESGLAQPDAAQVALEIAVAMRDLWAGGQYRREGQLWLTRALAQDPRPTRTRAVGLADAGSLTALLGDAEAGGRMLAEADALAERLGDPAARAAVTYVRGHLAWIRKPPDLARGMAIAEQALVEAQAVGDLRRVSLNLLLAASTGGFHGDPRAAGYAEQCRALGETHGARWTGAWGRLLLAAVRYKQGDGHQVAGLLHQALPVQLLVHDFSGASIGLEILAWTAAAAGDHERAARLLGAGQAIKRRDGASFADVGPYREHHAQCVRDARDALGEAAYAAAFEAGSRCTLEEAVGHALGGRRARHMPSRRPTRSAGDLLTRREEQIAALVAQGLTSRDIAAQLFISHRTAESHVDHILTKLGFTSRAQIAKWVAERR